MTTRPMPIHGADISHHQAGTLNLPVARKNGVQFLYHKATEGETFVDSNFNRRRAQAAAAKMPFGGYHFARAGKADAAREAKHFLSVCKPKPGDLRPALDLETTEGLSVAALRAWAKVFSDTIEKAIGVRPVVYTPFDLGAEFEKRHVIWRPRYNNSNTKPVLPYDIWQFSNGVFGVPNQVAGIGHCDLNTFAPGVKVDALIIPPKDKPKPPTPVDRLDVMHASLQFSISDEKTTSDLEKIFARAVKRKIAWITGTEAGTGSGNTRDELKRIAKANGYRLWLPSGVKGATAAEGATTDCWIAVRRDLIKGNWEEGFIPAIPGSRSLYKAQGLPDGLPRWGTKGLVHVAFDSVYGRISIGAGHYLTEARHPNAVVKGVDHWAWNAKFAAVIDEWATKADDGSGLTFYGGDQNMADALNTQPQGDTFFGGILESLGDELEQWPSTGHGPIDVIASSKADKRVTGAYWRALNDEAFPLNQDHFIGEGGFDVKRLAA